MMRRTPCWTLVAIAAVGCTGTMESGDPPAGPGGGAMEDGAVPVDGSGPSADAGSAAPEAGVGGGQADGGESGMDAGVVAPEDGGAPAPLIFEEVDGLVAVEAEHFSDNDDNGTPRSWHVTSAGSIPGVTPDPDEAHVEGASGGAYLEGLPDTRVTHDDPIVSGESFFNTAGTGPTLTYRVHFHTTGTYYGWARALTTGTEDNGVHLGIDDEWPGTANRMQWCGNRGSWSWRNAQRDSGGSACGVNGTITIEVTTPGEHLIRFSMREDGFEFDKFVLTTDPSYTPDAAGPDERPYTP